MTTKILSSFISSWTNRERRLCLAEASGKGPRALRSSRQSRRAGIIESVTLLRVLPFTRPALERYFELRKLLPRLGAPGLDLSISAIVLENNGVLVTRNRRDFEQGTDQRGRSFFEGDRSGTAHFRYGAVGGFVVALAGFSGSTTDKPILQTRSPMRAQNAGSF